MSSNGGIRLSGTSYAVLGLVDYLQPCTPYDLKRFIEQSIANFWPVPHTTFYAEPDRLAKAGYLTEHRENSGRRRKLYSLTDTGKDALQAWVTTPTAAPPELRDELELKVFLGADPKPLLDERLQWHQHKLAELQEYLTQLQAAHGPAGIERALVAGITYHQMLTDLTSEALSDTTHSERRHSRSSGKEAATP